MTADPRELLAPMKAKLTERRFDDPNWIFERKLDGARAIVVKIDGEARSASTATT